MGTSIVWIYFVTVVTNNGTFNYQVEKFTDGEECASYAHNNHKSLINKFSGPGEKLIASTCARENNVSSEIRPPRANKSIL